MARANQTTGNGQRQQTWIKVNNITTHTHIQYYMCVCVWTKNKKITNMKSKPHTKRLIKLLYTACVCNNGGGGGSIPKPFMRQKSVETYLKKFPAGIRFLSFFICLFFFSSPTSNYYTTTSCIGAAVATTTAAAVAATIIYSLGAHTHSITILSGVSLWPGSEIFNWPLLHTGRLNKIVSERFFFQISSLMRNSFIIRTLFQ